MKCLSVADLCEILVSRDLGWLVRYCRVGFTWVGKLWERCAINLAMKTTVFKSLVVVECHFMILLLHKNL